MPAKIPAHIREQQINDLPNISFVRWDGVYKNSKSKAICRCTVDGYEWSATVGSLLNTGSGCPQCAGNIHKTHSWYEQQINARTNIEFVRWANGYVNGKSKAICRCRVDGHEWAAQVASVTRGSGCPKCGKASMARIKRIPEEERKREINALPNITFVRWEGEYRNGKSKAICRCDADGFEWAASIGNLMSRGSGCPQCAKLRIAAALRTPSHVWGQKINSIPDIEFVRWAGDGRKCDSGVVFRCQIDGHEWTTTMRSVADGKSGCPKCAPYGFDPAKSGTLYILRSECGTMVKIGISNNYEQRHAQLRRRTPFDWNCIELLHSDDGSLIAELEKELHSFTEPATFREPFDGYTEWRKWDDRLPRWIERYRARLARIAAGVAR